MRIDTLPAVAVEAPLTIQQLRSNLGRAGVYLSRRPTAYEELAGIDPEAEARLWYEDILDKASEKTPELNRAFEQFNLPELSATLMQPGKMTAADRTRLAHHFVHFVESTRMRARVLATPGVDIEGAFAAYNFVTEDEAFRYAGVLEYMASAIRQQPFYGGLCSIVNYRLQPNEIDRNAMLRTAAFVKKDIRNHKGALPRVDKNPQNGKLIISYTQK